MSREWVNDEPDQWAMFCDVCRHRDPEVTRRQQDLAVYRDRGWYIAKLYGDLCPECVSAPPESKRAEPFDFGAFEVRTGVTA